MMMMTKRDFAEIYKRLKASGLPGKPLNAQEQVDQLNVYYDRLKDFEPTKVAEAVNSLIDSAEFFPSVSKIKQTMIELNGKAWAIRNGLIEKKPWQYR